MLEITLNGKPAHVKSGSSFQYVAENRAFTQSDSYTLNITFPLRDCAGNREIFGNMNRADVAKGMVRFDCELRAGSFCKRGVLTVTSADRSEVKGQFLEGRSLRNFSTSLDEIYINEIQPGGYHDVWPSKEYKEADSDKTYVYFTDAEKAKGYYLGINGGDREEDPTVVLLPWMSSSDGVLYNDYRKKRLWNVVEGEQQSLCWACPKENAVQGMRFLWSLTKNLFAGIGYEADLEEWKKTDYKYLVCCNSLPPGYGSRSYAEALPHWSVEEYMEELEKLLCGEFDVDHDAKTVVFRFTADAVAAVEDVRLENVLDDFTVDIEERNETKLPTKTPVAYADPGYPGWDALDCGWFVDMVNAKPSDGTGLRLQEFPVWGWAYEKLLNEWQRNWSKDPDADYSSVFRFADIDTYFLFKLRFVGHTGDLSYPYYFSELEPVDIFGAKAEDEDSGSEECRIVPVRLDVPDERVYVGGDEDGDLRNKVIFLDVPEAQKDPEPEGEGDEALYDITSSQPLPRAALEAGEDTGGGIYSNIYVAYWDGTWPEQLDLLCPFVDRYVPIRFGLYDYQNKPYSLRPADRCKNFREEYRKVDPRIKYTFSFLSDTVPNPRAVFYINNRRYLCGKITATVTEYGLSELMKGEFYPVDSEASVDV